MARRSLGQDCRARLPTRPASPRPPCCFTSMPSSSRASSRRRRRAGSVRRHEVVHLGERGVHAGGEGGHRGGLRRRIAASIGEGEAQRGRVAWPHHHGVRRERAVATLQVYVERKQLDQQRIGVARGNRDLLRYGLEDQTPNRRAWRRRASSRAVASRDRGAGRGSVGLRRASRSRARARSTERGRPPRRRRRDRKFRGR